MKSPKTRFRETFGRSSLYFEYFEIQKVQNMFVLANFFEYFEIFNIQKNQNIFVLAFFCIFWIFWNSKKSKYSKNNEITKKEVQRDFWEKFGGVVPFLRFLLLFWRPPKSSILNNISTQKSHQYSTMWQYRETNWRQWKSCVPKAPRENNSNEERSEEGTGKD